MLSPQVVAFRWIAASDLQQGRPRSTDEVGQATCRDYIRFPAAFPHRSQPGRNTAPNTFPYETKFIEKRSAKIRRRAASIHRTGTRVKQLSLDYLFSADHVFDLMRRRER